MLTELLIAGAGYAGFKLLQKKVRGSCTSVGEDVGKMKGVVERMANSTSQTQERKIINDRTGTYSDEDKRDARDRLRELERERRDMDRDD